MSVEKFLKKLPQKIYKGVGIEGRTIVFDDKGNKYDMTVGEASTYFKPYKGDKDLYSRSDIGIAKMGFKDENGADVDLAVFAGNVQALHESTTTFLKKGKRIERKLYYTPQPDVEPTITIAEAKKRENDEEKLIKESNNVSVIEKGKRVYKDSCEIESIINKKGDITRTYTVVSGASKYELKMIDDKVDSIKFNDGKTYKKYTPTVKGLKLEEGNGKEMMKETMIDMAKAVEFTENIKAGRKNDKNSQSNYAEFKKSQDAFKFIMDTVSANGFEKAPTKEDFDNKEQEYEKAVATLITEDPVKNIEYEELNLTEYERRLKEYSSRGKNKNEAVK